MLAHPPAYIISWQAPPVKINSARQRVNQRGRHIRVLQFTPRDLLSVMCGDLLCVSLARAMGGQIAREPKSLGGPLNIFPDGLPRPVLLRVASARENPLIITITAHIQPYILGPIYPPCLARLALPYRRPAAINRRCAQCHYISNPQASS